MNRPCPTTHGHLRCMHSADIPHVNCEVEDTSRCAIALGPYRDIVRTIAYVRGVIDFGAGGQLDLVGRCIGVERKIAEDDCSYRSRLTGALP